MKDIRNELEERLEDIERQISLAESRLSELRMTQNSLRNLLISEEERWGEQASLFGTIRVVRPQEGRTALSRFLLTSLKEKPKSVAMLTQEAQDASLLKDSKYPRRAIHFALVGMKRGRLVEKSNGVWKLKEQSGGDTQP